MLAGRIAHRKLTIQTVSRRNRLDWDSIITRTGAETPRQSAECLQVYNQDLDIETIVIVNTFMIPAAEAYKIT